MVPGRQTSFERSRSRRAWCGRSNAVLRSILESDREALVVHFPLGDAVLKQLKPQ